MPLSQIDKSLFAVTSASFVLSAAQLACERSADWSLLAPFCRTLQVVSDVYRATLLAELPMVRQSPPLHILTHPFSALASQTLSCLSGTEAANFPLQAAAAYVLAARARQEMRQPLPWQHLALLSFNAIGAAIACGRSLPLSSQTEQEILNGLQQKKLDQERMEETWRARRKEHPELAELKAAKQLLLEELDISEQRLRDHYQQLLERFHLIEETVRKESNAQDDPFRRFLDDLERQIDTEHCPPAIAANVCPGSEIARAAGGLRPECPEHAKLILSCSFDEQRWRAEKNSYINALYRIASLKTHPDRFPNNPLAEKAFIAIAAAKNTLTN